MLKRSAILEKVHRQCPQCQMYTVSRWRMLFALIPFFSADKCSFCGNQYKISKNFRDNALGFLFISFAFSRGLSFLKQNYWSYSVIAFAILLVLFSTYFFAKPKIIPIRTGQSTLIDILVITIVSLAILWILFIAVRF